MVVGRHVGGSGLRHVSLGSNRFPPFSAKTRKRFDRRNADQAFSELAVVCVVAGCVDAGLEDLFVVNALSQKCHVVVKLGAKYSVASIDLLGMSLSRPALV